MRVFFERSGGFAGMKLHRAIDSKDLSPDQARRLDLLLKQSRLFDLPDNIQRSPSGMDRFYYRLTVESDEGIRKVETSEASVPEEMRPLIDWLTRFSRP
jgi:hypothetical protein